MVVEANKSANQKAQVPHTFKGDKRGAYLTLAAVLAIGVSSSAMAGTTGDELEGVYTAINELMGGYGGRIIVLGGMAASGILGYVRQSMTIAGTGIGLALLIANAPAIADGMVSATI